MNERESKLTNSNNSDKSVRRNGSQFNSTESSASNKAKPIQELTPEEQMALYEKELKENDWGHQPC
jgi:hypothetical protein